MGKTAMPSCCESSKPSLSSLNNCHSPSDPLKRRARVTSYFSSLSPVLSALLHSSCCWLPTLLDLTTLGSASAAAFNHLRPVFLAVTLLVLLDSIRRQGLNRHNLVRILLSGLVLIFPRAFDYYQQTVTTNLSKKSCH